MMQIDGWRNNAGDNGLDGDSRFDRTGRSKRMPDHRLGRTDEHMVCMLSEHRLNGLCLCAIIVWSRCAMRVNVIHLIGA